MPLRVAVIVEGHGEFTAIRGLLNRIWYEHLNGDGLEVLRPFRIPQGKILNEDGLKKAVDAAKIDLDRRPPDDFRKLVIILIDSEGKPPCQLAPQLLLWANQARSDADIACVLPHIMFETWFVAAATSLAGQNDLPSHLTTPDKPEENRLGKGWLKKQLPRKYIETVDQARFVGRMNLAECRANSPSFDKLCRELQKRMPISDAANVPPQQ